MTRSLTVLLALGLTAAAAPADMIIGTAPIPTSDVLVAQSVSTATRYELDDRTPTDNAYGQTFLLPGTGSFALDKLIIGGQAKANGTATFTLSIYEIADSSSVTPVATVTQQSATFGLAYNATYNKLQFDLDDVTLQGGKQYAFLLDLSGYNNKFYLFNGAGDVDASGVPIQRNASGVFSSPGSADVAYWLVGTPIPEPATMGLLAFGAVGAVFRRKR